MGKLDEFKTEITLAGATAIVGLITIVLHEVTLACLVWALGVLMTILAITLKRDLITVKRELIDQFKDEIEIYKKLEGIQDDEFHEEGRRSIKNCKDKLNELAGGIYSGGTDEVLARSSERLKDVEELNVTHLADTAESLHCWEEDRGIVKYYETNKEAAEAKKKIYRIFIIDKRLIFGTDGKVTDKKAVDIMRKQSCDGIEVAVVWMQDLPRKLSLNCRSEDFAIFDDSIVHVQKIGDKQMYDEATIIKDRSKVDRYVDRFNNLKDLSSTLDKLF